MTILGWEVQTSLLRNRATRTNGSEISKDIGSGCSCRLRRLFGFSYEYLSLVLLFTIIVRGLFDGSVVGRCSGCSGRLRRLLGQTGVHGASVFEYLCLVSLSKSIVRGLFVLFFVSFDNFFFVL